MNCPICGGRLKIRIVGEIISVQGEIDGKVLTEKEIKSQIDYGHRLLSNRICNSQMMLNVCSECTYAE